MNQTLFLLLKELENPSRIEKVSYYMQAHPSQNSYAKGDIFVGITVPEQRAFVKKHFQSFQEEDILKLLTSPIHEYRSISIIFLIEKLKKTKDQKTQESIVNFYIEHLEYINHWDLVDNSAPNILGKFLYSKLPDYKFLIQLAHNPSIWYQRIALVSTLYFIRQGIFEPTFHIAQLLFPIEHPMVQKALGWMLKEIGKKDLSVAVGFLKLYLADINPLALSIAQEKYPQDIKQSLKSYRNIK